MTTSPVAGHAGRAEHAAAVEIAALTRRFGGVTAVDDLTLSIPRASIFGLLGPNGAGKTTALKMLATLLPPSEGTARIAGLDIVEQPREVRRRLGYVPQLVSAEGALTARENLMVFARLYGVARRERRDRVRQALQLIGLEEAADLVVKRFSGGMIRRLEIAQAVIHRPSVLLLDEPTVGLDPIARRTVWEHVRDLRERFGTTVLLTTHYMEEADELCDAVAVLHLGKMAALGAPARLKAEVGEHATLDDVFTHFTGNTLDTGGNYRDVARTRRTARRLG